MAIPTCILSQRARGSFPGRGRCVSRRDEGGLTGAGVLVAQGTEGLAESGTGEAEQQPAQRVERHCDRTRACPLARDLQGSQGPPWRGFPSL